jgi:uncharacterized protein YhfF
MASSREDDVYWRGRILELQGWSFGDTPEMADELLDLVLRGIKSATCSLHKAFKDAGDSLPVKGEESYVKDSQGRPRCVIRITKVELVPMNEITEAFARKEGEGDLSLDYWHREHRRYFELYCKITESELLVCEEFEVVHVFKDHDA